MVKIRAAGDDDAAEIARLCREVQAFHLAAEPEAYRDPGMDEVEAWFREQIGLDEVGVLVGETGDGRAAGYAFVRLVDRPGHVFARPRRLACVEQLGVSADERRSGVGRALMEAVEALAREAECDTIELDVRAFNAGAIGFYEAIGYRPVTHRLSRRMPR